MWSGSDGWGAGSGVRVALLAHTNHCPMRVVNTLSTLILYPYPNPFDPYFVPLS